MKIIFGVDFGKRIPYTEQSGALNESYADIFGAIIENKNGDGFYQKSEDSGDLFYDIRHLSTYNLPQSMADYDCEADIHFNGVIFTRAWYLMLEDERVRATCLPQLPAGLNMGLAGIPWWTTDIGGFLGGNPDDPTAWDIQDEYLLGGDVLVAPILFEGQRSRRVYLPGKDTWKNAHTGESFSGGQWVEAEAPPDVIPVFLREGGAADFAL